MTRVLVLITLIQSCGKAEPSVPAKYPREVCGRYLNGDGREDWVCP